MKTTPYLLKVEEGVTYVRLYMLKPEAIRLIKLFERRFLTQWGKVPGAIRGTCEHKVTNVFGIFSPDETEYRMAKAFLPLLRDMFYEKDLDFPESTMNDAPPPPSTKITFDWLEEPMRPRDAEQQDYCDFIVNDEFRLVVVNTAPGSGKTIMTIMSFVKMGYRVLLTVLPRFVSIWKVAFSEKLSLSKDDIIDVSDYDFNDLYKKFQQGEINPKIIFFSLTRIDIYLKRYHENPTALPHLDEFYAVMNVGVRIVDEAHEFIHNVYSSLMYGNFYKTIALSATLVGDNDFVNRIYSHLFPSTAYLKSASYHKYMTSITYVHSMNIRRHRIRYQGFGGYQHSLYEGSILKNKIAFEGYYRVVKSAFIQFYLEKRRPGQKALFFFSTVAMCDKITQRLKKDFAKLDIIAFTFKLSKQKGMSEEYKNHDIVITTPNSCGTGKDITKLYIVFSGVSVSSTQRIDQMTGRLRDISKWWPGASPVYLTFVCRDIRKQIQYDRKKKDVIRRKTKKFILVKSGITI